MSMPHPDMARLYPSVFHIGEDNGGGFFVRRLVLDALPGVDNPSSKGDIYIFWGGGLYAPDHFDPRTSIVRMSHARVGGFTFRPKMF